MVSALNINRVYEREEAEEEEGGEKGAERRVDNGYAIKSFDVAPRAHRKISKGGRLADERVT